MENGDFDWLIKQNIDKYDGFWVCVKHKKILRFSQTLAGIHEALQQTKIKPESCLIIKIEKIPTLLRSSNDKTRYHLHVKI